MHGPAARPDAPAGSAAARSGRPPRAGPRLRTAQYQRRHPASAPRLAPKRHPARVEGAAADVGVRPVRDRLHYVPVRRRSRRAGLGACHLRWQVGLVYRRFKSVARLGHLPNLDDDSTKVWIWTLVGTRSGKPRSTPASGCNQARVKNSARLRRTLATAASTSGSRSPSESLPVPTSDSAAGLAPSERLRRCRS